MINTFKAVVAGTGAYLPEKILTNQDLEKTLDTNDAWITERTGIRERRIAGDNESSSTMAAEAGKQALETARVSADDVKRRTAEAEGEELALMVLAAYR